MRPVTALRFGLALLLLLSSIPAFAQAVSTPYDAVDPLIGTSGGGETLPRRVTSLRHGAMEP